MKILQKLEVASSRFLACKTEQQAVDQLNYCISKFKLTHKHLQLLPKEVKDHLQMLAEKFPVTSSTPKTVKKVVKNHKLLEQWIDGLTTSENDSSAIERLQKRCPIIMKMKDES